MAPQESDAEGGAWDGDRAAGRSSWLIIRALGQRSSLSASTVVTAFDLEVLALRPTTAVGGTLDEAAV